MENSMPLSENDIPAVEEITKILYYFQIRVEYSSFMPHVSDQSAFPYYRAVL